MVQLKIQNGQQDPEVLLEAGVKTVVLGPQHSAQRLARALQGLLPEEEIEETVQLWGGMGIERRFLKEDGAVYIRQAD